MMLTVLETRTVQEDPVSPGPGTTTTITTITMEVVQLLEVVREVAVAVEEFHLPG